MKKYLVILIILASYLRFYQLDKLPSILNRDEAAIAYNAFLLKNSGFDEWQRKWPLVLQSFGDYKLPVYPYLTFLGFYFFGINDFAVRFWSALAGVLLVIVSYFFGLRLALNKKEALIFAFLVAISPIFFFYSRSAYEANLALLFLVISLLFLFFIPQNNWKNNFFVLGCLLAAIFCYNTPFILFPFLILAFIIFRFYRNKKDRKKNFLFFCLLGFIFITGMVFLFSLTKQKSGISFLFSKNDPIIISFGQTNEEKKFFYFSEFANLTPFYKINRMLFLAKILITNFNNSLSFNFLVLRGGNHPWHSLPYHGHIYFLVYLFFVLFILKEVFYYLNLFFKFVCFIYQKKSKSPRIDSQRILLDYLLIVSLIPACITTDAPHATRSLLFFYLLSFLSLQTFFSLVHLVESLKFKSYFFYIIQIIFIWIFVFWLVIESIIYFQAYFVQYPKYQAMYKAGFENFINNFHASHRDKKVVILDQDGYQYILLAWYLKVKSTDFFSTIKKQLPNNASLRYGEELLNYRFIVHQDDRREEKFLLYFDNNQFSWKFNEF